MTYTEAQMREALEGEIKAAAPLAVVFPWWALEGMSGPGRESWFRPSTFLPPVKSASTAT